MNSSEMISISSGPHCSLPTRGQICNIRFYELFTISGPVSKYIIAITGMVYFAEGDGSYNYLYDMIVNIISSNSNTDQ